MRIAPVFLLGAVISGLPAGASQGPIPKPPTGTVPRPTSPMRSQELAVDVTGCIHGTRLQPSSSSVSDAQIALLNASEFVLDGPRELIQQLTREHDGHEERISGIALLPRPPADTTVEIKTVKKGRTTITGGVRDRPPSRIQDGKLPVRIKVQSATHLADRCAARP
jgi:hypothetical protein